MKCLAIQQGEEGMEKESLAEQNDLLKRWRWEEAWRETSLVRMKLVCSSEKQKYVWEFRKGYLEAYSHLITLFLHQSQILRFSSFIQNFKKFLLNEPQKIKFPTHQIIS